MLQVENLHQVFNPGDVNEVEALQDVNLTLHDEQFVTVIGSNGAGKSTLFNAISGVFEPSAGTVVIDGTDVTGWSEHRRGAWIGRVFQNPLLGTAAPTTIVQNLTLALSRGQRLRLRAGVTTHREQIFVDALSPLGLGLEDRLDTRVSLLSGGQRRSGGAVLRRRSGLGGSRDTDSGRCSFDC